MQNNSPKPMIIAIKVIILHTLGVQVMLVAAIRILGAKALPKHSNDLRIGLGSGTLGFRVVGFADPAP